MTLNVGMAFLAGIVAFLAPCVLPLVPIYLSYLSGVTLSTEVTGDRRTRWFIAGHAVAFVIGFTVVLVLLGTAVGALGSFLRGSTLRTLTAVLLIFFGLVLTGQLKLTFLEGTYRLPWQGKREWGLLSSFLVGMTFAAGWTPCAGPVLGAILALSAQSATAGEGARLLLAFSAGLGLPFILVAFGLEPFNRFLRRSQRLSAFLPKLAGAFLLLAGVVLLFNGLPWLVQLFETWELGWNLGL